MERNRSNPCFFWGPPPMCPYLQPPNQELVTSLSCLGSLGLEGNVMVLGGGEPQSLIPILGGATFLNLSLTPADLVNPFENPLTYSRLMGQKRLRRMTPTYQSRSLVRRSRPGLFKGMPYFNRFVCSNNFGLPFQQRRFSGIFRFFDFNRLPSNLQ